MASSGAERSYADRASDYARRVVAGEIVAGKWVRLACERHLAWLRTSSELGFTFDADQVDRYCSFIELLPHVEGSWGSKTIELADWQCFFVASVVGWLDQRTGLRVTRRAYLFVARKNGKTTLAAALELALMCLDEEPGAKGYNAATKREQARLCFDIAKAMVEASPEMQDAFAVEPKAGALVWQERFAALRPLSADAKTQDGLNPHVVVADEFHEWPDRAFWDKLTTAMGARRQPVLFVTSTAGDNSQSVCFEQWSAIERQLEGVLESDPRTFALIYTLDEGDDPADPSTWVKANPNRGISQPGDYLESQLRDSQSSPAARAAFERYHANRWVSGEQRWLDMAQWRACPATPEGELLAGPLLVRRSHKGARPCFVGADLASRRDVCALVAVFPPQPALSGTGAHVAGSPALPAGDPFWRVLCRLYLNQAAVDRYDKLQNANWRQWQRLGWLTVTPGDVTDFDLIARDAIAWNEEFAIQAVGYDPPQAPQWAQGLAAAGLPMVAVPKTSVRFHAPMTELEALVAQGRIDHGGNPVLAWMASNVVVRRKPSELLFPSKTGEASKIDGIDGLLTGLERALVALPVPPPPIPYTAERGLRTL